MKLHIFNPEHDIALAYHRKHLTVPHAAQELRMNLGWIPALWAADGDAVLVDDIPYAVKAATKYFHKKKLEILFLSKEQLRNLHFDDICPWGWDITLKTMLQEQGVPENLLPNDQELQQIRLLSSRVQTTDALSFLRAGLEHATCGESVYVTTEERVKELLRQMPRMVIKAPWSSSGRGVRYIDGLFTPSVTGFIRNVIHTQGGVMVEPYYNKVKDFGMEFEVSADGAVNYLGLSLFETRNGAYTGNLIATEEEKREMLEKYVSAELLDTIIRKATDYFSRLFGGRYAGAFGVDMMIVTSDRQEGFLLHPCVEINLRRTMGHVALSIPHQATDVKQLMSIVYDVNYQLKMSNIENNFVLTV